MIIGSGNQAFAGSWGELVNRKRFRRVWGVLLIPASLMARLMRSRSRPSVQAQPA